MTLTTTQLDQLAANFLAIVPENRVEMAQRALHLVLTAYTEGEIYNTVYKDAKEDLGRCVDEGYDAKTRDFWTGAANHDNGEHNGGFMWYIGHISNLHNTISLANKLARDRSISEKLLAFH